MIHLGGSAMFLGADVGWGNRESAADFGRVLVALQVPVKQKAAFRKFLDRLGYAYWDESRNPAYALFLA